MQQQLAKTLGNHAISPAFFSCIFFLCAIIVCSGCATISGRKQVIKIATEPEGATVFYKNENLGVTPGFFLIPRNQQTELRFVLNSDVAKTEKLTSTYRWGDSFFSNFVWGIVGAPIGWAVDLSSGAAWNYEHLPPITLLDPEFLAKAEVIPTKKIIAIAPPTTNYLLLSDEVGERLEAKLKMLYPEDTVLPYKSTLSTFIGYNYNHQNSLSIEQRDGLYADLKATHIAETEVERTDEEVVLKEKVTDVFTDKTIKRLTEDIPRTEFHTLERGLLVEAASKIVDIIPNTFSYGLKTSSVNMEFENFSPPFVPYLDTSASVFNYLAGLGFRNSRNPKLNRGFQPFFHLVPSVSLDYVKVRFQRDFNNDLNGVGFDWFLFTLGIGPEIGLESAAGYFYLQFVPELGVNYIHAKGQGNDFWIWSSSFAKEIEFGYLVFISNRINLRIYNNVATGFNQAWGETMSFMTNYNVPVKSASDAVFGLSIGYFFPESQTKVKNWLF